MEGRGTDITRAVPRLDHDVEVFEDDHGNLHLRGRELRGSLAARCFAWFFRLPKRIEVELDEIGRFVVERMDGRTMETLSGDLVDHLRLEDREAKAALTVFVRNLLRRRLVRLEGLDG